MSRTARVTFSYKAEQKDELSLEVGDIVENIVDVDVGWCEGELNGKKGMFPNNFVEEITVDSPDSNSDRVSGKKAKVMFDYEALDQDELSLKLNEIVDILGEEEPGWWKGQLANKVGVFPSNFVELIDEKDVAQPKDTPVETQRKHSGEAALPAKEAPSSDNVDGLLDEEELEIKRHPSVGASAKKQLGGGMGFGNLINPNVLAEKKLKKVHHDVKKEKKAKPEDKSSVTSAEPSKPSTVKTKAPALSAKSRPAPPVPPSPPMCKKPPSEQAKVTFAYEPENPDELRLVEGDIVTVLNKDIVESEGWWEGEVNGKVGMFPNNFVELLPAEKEDTSVKEKASVHPPSTSKKGVPVLPVANLDEVKKSPKTHKKPTPSLHTKDESDSDVSSELPLLPGRPERPAQVTPKELHKKPGPSFLKKEEQDTEHTLEVTRPALGKKPTAPQKPNLPPKKPLPVKTKKPDITLKKPEKKVDTPESYHLKEPLQDEESSKPADKKPAIPEIKTTAEAPVSFDDVPQTETLNHLTANRAKVPQKRAPSKEGRLTDSARLSADLDEHVAETNKQPPGRPKEPPKEPAWKREVREAREKKQAPDEKAPPPILAPKSDAVEKRKSILRDEAQEQAPPVQKVEPFTTTTTGEVEKLRKEVSELREMVHKLEKKHNESIKKLEEKFLREIEILTNDFYEEKKQKAVEQATLNVELDRLKRRQSRLSADETQ